MEKPKSNLNRCKCLVIIIVGLSLLFLIPFTLNEGRQCESSLKSIIGGGKAPQAWLSLWGSYIASIGSIIAATVALWNSKKERVIIMKTTHGDAKAGIRDSRKRLEFLRNYTLLFYLQDLLTPIKIINMPLGKHITRFIINYEPRV